MRNHFISGAVAVLALGTIAIPASAQADGGGTQRVRLQDDCDPASFNLAIGPGTCIPHGDDDTVTFGEFVAALDPVDHVGHEDWNNHPDELDLEVGDSIRAVVRGGEFHTFTEVPEFGPGCIPFLNEGLGLTGPAPTEAECFAPGGILDSTGVLPNGLSTLTVSGLSVGTHKFMCEIHPWMRTVVTVGGDDD